MPQPPRRTRLDRALDSAVPAWWLRVPPPFRIGAVLLFLGIVAILGDLPYLGGLLAVAAVVVAVFGTIIGQSRP